MAKIELNSKEDVAHWLAGRPREDAIVLAARAVLRMVPLLAWPGERATSISAETWRKDILLPCMRATASPWLAARYPSQGGERRAAAAAAASSAASSASIPDSIPAATIYASAASYAADAAAAAAASTFTTPSYAAYAADAASDAADAASYAADAAAASAASYAAAWYATTLDARALAGVDGVALLSPTALASQPLWPEGEPKWARKSILDFGSYLLKLQSQHPAEHWGVWLDWYAARLNGGNAFGLSDAAAERVETGILLLPEEVWEAGPAKVNPAIRALIDAEKAGEVDPDDLPPESAIPPQDRRGLSFGGEADEPIRLETMDAPDRLRSTPERQEDYDDIRQKAEAIKAEGVNRVSHLMGPMERLLSLSINLSGVRAQQFWSRVNTLRIKHNGHLAAVEAEKSTGEKDERRLDGIVADLLADLVETINAFHLGDPRLVEFDAARPGPKDIAQIRAELAPILPVLSGVADKPEIVAADASEVLKESITEAGQTGDSLAERQSVEASSRTLRNFVMTMVNRAYRPLKKLGGAAKGEAGFASKEFRGGFYKDMGASAAKSTRFAVVALASAAYIASNKAAMISYVTTAFPNAPALIQIIEFIAKAFGG